MTKSGSRGRWHLDSHGIRRLGEKESGFTFVASAGLPISAPRTLERIKKLRIPPAWTSVRIARSDLAPLQAVGVDKKGRTQYLYHARFRQRRDDEKFLRIVEFGESLPRLRRRVSADLRRPGFDRLRVVASIVRLIDQGFFRVGNDKSAEAELTFGLTTVRSEHVRVSGSTIKFDYVGKWRKTQKKTVVDAHVARVIRKASRIGGDELFKFEQGTRLIDVKDRHVNEYIQSIIGEKFSAKDFRTWAGTLICSIGLAMQGQAPSKVERKRRIRKALEATAAMLGNTTAVCRTSYICPRLLDDYLEGRPFDPMKRRRRGSPVARQSLSGEERALLRFLRETIGNRRKTSRAA